MKMIAPNRFFKFSLTLLFATTLFACTHSPQTPTDLTLERIIPLPVSVTGSGESFTLTDESGVYHNGFMELLSPGIYLAEHLVSSTGFSFSEVSEIHKTPRKGNIFLVLDSTRTDLGLEGYELSITPKLVQITGFKTAGIFYGIQTLLQMLPVSTTRAMAVPLTLATGIIKDSPEYAYRGAMLDVARHFFKPDDVKRFIDLMAVYKLNYLHLHLADDQGWRIEIKSWSKLTVHGGSTQVGGGAGGFYTQEEYKDIVRYAQTRYITIVPEIDMPGHTNAALASYAELNCNGKATRLYTGTNVGFSTLCTSKEVTYQFISDVFRELAGLTPGPYIHIGGDESHVTKLADYIPFINRVQEIVSSHGKQTMGWDDIAAATLKPGTIAQHWATVPNAVNAAGQGSKLVLSPARKAYLDMKYDSSTRLGLNWAGYIEVDSAYLWSPETFVPGIGKENILGIEAPLWSETVTNIDEVEFMTFPRLPGYAEIGWTPPAMRVWDEYKVRLAEHGARLQAMGVDFYRSPRVPWK